MSPKEPTISDIPTLMPDQDDIARRQRQPESTPPKPARKGTARSAIVLLLVSAVGGLGWLAYQQHNQSAELQSALQQANSRIVALEQQLDVADENFSTTDSAVQAQLKLQMHEIRKLWDLSNKRNKVDIKTNSNSIDELKGKLLAANEKVSQVDKISKITTDHLNQLDLTSTLTTESLNELRTSLQTVTQTAAGNETGVARLSKQTSDTAKSAELLTEKVAALESSTVENDLIAVQIEQSALLDEQDSLKQQVSSLSSKLAAVTKALQALEASRVAQ